MADVARTYFDKEELKSRGTFKGNNLAKRAKAAGMDFIRLQSVLGNSASQGRRAKKRQRGV